MNKNIVQKSNKEINKFITWLENNNFAPKTVKTYSEEVHKYSNNLLTTETIEALFRKKLKKLEPNTLLIHQSALKAYAKYKKLRIDWERITKLIPKVQRKFFNTIDSSELERIKQTVIQRKKFQERNKLNTELFLLYWIKIARISQYSTFRLTRQYVKSSRQRQ